VPRLTNSSAISAAASDRRPRHARSISGVSSSAGKARARLHITFFSPGRKIGTATPARLGVIWLRLVA